MDATAVLVVLGGAVVIVSLALVWHARPRSGDRDGTTAAQTERVPLHERLAPLVESRGELYAVRRGQRRRRHRDGLVAGTDGSIRRNNDWMDEDFGPPRSS